MNTVRIGVAVPPDMSVTPVGLNDAIGPLVMVVFETVGDRVMVADGPFRLVRMIREVPSEPSPIFRNVGLAVMVKSGGIPYTPSWCVWATGVAVPSDMRSLKMWTRLKVLTPAV